MILTNLHLKIISGLLAVCLWIYLVTGEFQEISLYVPVKLTNIPEGYVAVTGENLVNVMAKGPRSLVKDKQFNKVQIAIDVSKMQPGSNSKIINPEDVQMPAGIQVTDIVPKSIEITVDSLIRRKMKIVPTFIGEPLLGYKVASVTVSPETVEANAAKSKIEKQVSVETMPINLSDKKDPVTYSIGLKSYEGIQNYTPEQVEVVVVFKEDIQEKSIDKIPVAAQNTPDNLVSIVTDTVTLKLSGRVDLLTPEAVAAELDPHVDLSGINGPGHYRKRVVFRNSNLIDILKISPTKVGVEVRE